MSKFPAMTAPLARTQIEANLFAEFLGGAHWTSDVAPERSKHLTNLAHVKLHEVAEAMGYDLVPRKEPGQ